MTKSMDKLYEDFEELRFDGKMKFCTSDWNGDRGIACEIDKDTWVEIYSNPAWYDDEITVYEMIPFKNGNKEHFYGMTREDDYDITSVNQVLSNLCNGASYTDKSWCKGLRCYGYADESESDYAEDMMESATLDEKIEVGNRIPDIKNKIKSRIKMRDEQIKRHPEEAVSGVALADKVAEAKISGKEKRTITPEVGAEIRRRMAEKYRR